MKTRSIISGLAVGLLALPWGCSTVDHRLGVERPAEPRPFVSAPEDSGALDGSELITNYCPSNRCSPGHKTCPSSQFLCDVDLLTDLNNCGECGNKCPQRGYICTEGRCMLSCNNTNEFDCDGIPDNGCEAKALSNDNCGYCGNKCPADKPCVERGIQDIACGCKPGLLYCGGFAPCIDPSQDDKNCGACGNACPPEGDGAYEAPPNTYFGCFDGACGTLKCKGNFGDCDGDPDNGCETSFFTDDSCGACGNECQDGTTCGVQFMLGLMRPMCMCPKGTTFCGGSITMGSEVLKLGDCLNLNSDRYNCGGCGTACPNDVPNAEATCVYGMCNSSCFSGWGDCNGSPQDGCETHIASDPKNCGGCGIVCDGIAGQACVDGQCMVEPCDELQDAGGPPR